MASLSLTREKTATEVALPREKLSKLEWLCLVVVVLALSLRLFAFPLAGLESDGAAYMSMAVSLLRDGEFHEPGTGEFTQHFPPVYPALLALAFAVLGASYAAAHVVGLLSAAFLVGVAYWTTKDLFGREKGFAVAALTAAFPVLLPFDLHVLSESLVAAFFALTIWAILKSLDKPAFIVLAGAFAALGYLTKASMGVFVVLAGVGGLAWRFAYMRWRVLTDRYYLAAAGIVVATVLAWAARNVARHGWPNWQTQRHASESFRIMFETPGWPVVLGKEFVWSAFVLLCFALPFLVGIRRALPRWREEKTSGLLMAVVTPTIVAVFFVTAFFITEGMQNVVNTLNKRYLVTPIVPLLWLGLRDVDFRATAAPAGKPESGERRARVGVALAVAGVAILALALALDPTQERLSLGRVVLLFAAVGAGGLVLAASRFFMVKPATRTKGRDETWRWVPDDAGAKRALVVLALLAAGLLVAFYWALSLLVFFVAAAAMAAFKDARAGVAAAAVVMLAGSSAGAFVLASDVAIAEDLNAHAPAGAVVKVYRHDDRFVYPFLREDVVLDRLAEDPDFIVDHLPAGRNPEPPEGYEAWRSYSFETTHMPGTMLARAIERAVTGQAPGAPERPAAFVYAALPRAP